MLGVEIQIYISYYFFFSVNDIYNEIHIKEITDKIDANLKIFFCLLLTFYLRD